MLILGCPRIINELPFPSIHPPQRDLDVWISKWKGEREFLSSCGKLGGGSLGGVSRPGEGVFRPRPGLAAHGSQRRGVLDLEWGGKRVEWWGVVEGSERE